MTSRRVLKAAESIRKIVSTAINTELRDPRVGMVTVTNVGLSADLRHAVVKISVMGDETKAKLTLGGLRSAAGFLQSKIAKGLEMRYTPRLTFEIDEGVKKSLAMAQLLREVLPDDASNARPADASAEFDEPADVESDEAFEPADDVRDELAEDRIAAEEVADADDAADDSPDESPDAR